MVCFRDNRLYLTLLGGLLVVSGVVMKNTAEQLPGDQKLLEMAGPVSFVIGWIIVAYSVALPVNSKRYLAALELDQRTVQSFAAGAAIVISVFMMKNLMKAGKPVPMMYPALFAGGWLLLGYTVGGYLGAAAALSVLISMMSILPWQRSNCVIDGPGMPLYTAAWILLAAANSLN